MGRPVSSPQNEDESVAEFVAGDEIEESDLSDLEDWERTGEEEVSSELESESSEEEEREPVVIGKKRTVQIEYETELQPKAKLKA